MSAVAGGASGSRSGGVHEDVLYHKSGGSWRMRLVRLVPSEQKLELLAAGEGSAGGGSTGGVSVLLQDGFMVHVVGPNASPQGGAEPRMFAFNVVGSRGELSLAAGSLEARQAWMSRLEALRACVPVAPRPRSSGSSYVDGRTSAHVDGVFGSYLYRQKGWRKVRRYYLLLAERSELRCCPKAPGEAEREALAATGRLPADAVVVLDFLASRAVKVDHVSSAKFRVSAGGAKLTLDARAPDLAQAWIRKLQNALTLAQRREREERDFRTAVRASTRTSRQIEQDDSRRQEEDLRMAIQLSLQDHSEEHNVNFVATRRNHRRRPSVRPSSVADDEKFADVPVEAFPVTITVTIRSAGGTVFTVALPATATFKTLKDNIHNQKPDYPPHRIRLLFNGKSVAEDDNATLLEKRVQDNANLYLVLCR